MDRSTIIGLIAGVVMLGWAMTTGAPLSAYFDLPSLMIVVGGVVCVVLISFPLRSTLGAGKIVRNAFVTKDLDPAAVIADLVRYAEIARRDGILALEDAVKDIDDPFMVTGIRMAVDGTNPALIAEILNAEMDAMADRHGEGKAIFDNLGRYGPAFGMIGTLVGLVVMLKNMGNDPSKIGPGMAIALLTTLYGALIANLICLPIGEKLARRSRQELFIKSIIVKGVIAIQSGDNPRIVEQKLRTFLPAQRRDAAPPDRVVPAAEAVVEAKRNAKAA